MIKLLNAEFTRLRKSKSFWVGLAFSILFGFYIVLINYSVKKENAEKIEVEQLMLYYSILMGIVIAIFTSLFLSAEYADGAIRNKISIGHKRVHIYLSNLIITIVINVLFYILYLIVVASIGIPLFGGITMQISQLWLSIGCICISILAYSSIFTCLTMLLSNKVVASILSILIALILFVAASVCLNILKTPKVITVASHVNGEIVLEEVPNPKYPSETKKKVCQTFLDINPTGQMLQITSNNTTNLKMFPLYAFGVLFLFTGVGLIVFYKKELK